MEDKRMYQWIITISSNENYAISFNIIQVYPPDIWTHICIQIFAVNLPGSTCVFSITPHYCKDLYIPIYTYTKGVDLNSIG